MPPPNIPAAKRAGLPVDIARLATEGDDWLSPEERFALKTYGICTQLQPHVFMVRIRIPGGVLPTAHARGAGRLAAQHGEEWLHLTTRQNLELHWVPDRAVPALLEQMEGYGLSTRSACGHTVRNVMASEDAGVGLDEPFDCLPDARLISDTLIGRSAQLNTVLPSRLNIALGGSPRCRDDALVNDIGLVSMIVDGVAGYELWAGGSLGKAPSLAVLLTPFVPSRGAGGRRGARGPVRQPRQLRRAGQGSHEVLGRAAGRRCVPFGVGRGVRRRLRRDSTRRSPTCRSSVTPTATASSPRAHPGGGGPACDHSATQDSHRSRSTCRSATSSRSRWSCSAISPTGSPTGS